MQESAPMTPMVQFKDVTKRYGDNTVLDQLNLDIAANEKVSIIGPSGSGKTTVLRMLMTLARDDVGSIWLERQPLTHLQRNGKLLPADDRHWRKARGKSGIEHQQLHTIPT